MKTNENENPESPLPSEWGYEIDPAEYVACEEPTHVRGADYYDFQNFELYE